MNRPIGRANQLAPYLKQSTRNPVRLTRLGGRIGRRVARGLNSLTTSTDACRPQGRLRLTHSLLQLVSPLMTTSTKQSRLPFLATEPIDRLPKN